MIDARLKTLPPPVLAVGLLTEQLGLSYQTDRLIDALWVQFRNAVVDDLQFRRCDVCRNPMRVGAAKGGSRTDSLYCSTACRLKAYRGRIKRARSMHAAGSTPTCVARGATRACRGLAAALEIGKSASDITRVAV